MDRNNKNVVRLTESKLREMIKETVSDILKEGMFDTAKAMWSGAKSARDMQNTVNRWEKSGDSQNIVNAYTQGQSGNIDGMADEMAENIVDYLENMCNRNNMHADLVAKYVIYKLQKYNKATDSSKTNYSEYPTYWQRKQNY